MPGLDATHQRQGREIACRESDRQERHPADHPSVDVGILAESLAGVPTIGFDVGVQPPLLVQSSYEPQLIIALDDEQEPIPVSDANICAAAACPGEAARS